MVVMLLVTPLNHLDGKKPCRTWDKSWCLAWLDRQGEIKVSGNFNNPEAFKKSLDAAIELRAYANSRMYPTNDNTSKTDKEV